MGEKISMLKQAVLSNKGPKAAALLLALIAWYAIQSVINFETVVPDVPLTVQLDPGWAILDWSAKTADVVFRGSQEDIRYLNKDQVKVELDIRGKPVKGSLTVRLTPKNVRSPGAVRPILVKPDQVTLRLDQEGEKQVPVKADLQGVPPEGYEVERIVCTPASVVVYGPRRRLDEIDVVRTAPIDLEGRSRSFKKLKMSLLQPSETWTARMSPSNVVVEVMIAERAATKEVEDVPVTVLVPPGSRQRFDVWPQRIKVTLRGRAELLKDLKKDDVVAFIDCASLDTGATYDLPVRVTAGPGLTALGIEPPTVKVTAGDL
ncbi:MAG TPA: CdaR family protein [Kiritimatiellia bacterium]|nr:CdaR family protein [Kiritimatiellia bacterium]